MKIDSIKNISDGARAYLVPVGSVSGGRLGLGCAVPGLRFLAARLVVRDGGTTLWQSTVPVEGLDNVISELPVRLQAQLAQQLEGLSALRQNLVLPGRALPLSFSRPRIMGVLNVTPDSFSDGGQFLDTGAAIRHARQMITQGADIIDIGGESTRPGAKPVWEGEEAERIMPVIEALQADGIPLSVDTRHSYVMEKAAKAGAHILNDVSALTYDGDSMQVAAACDLPIVLMHAQGTPETMQDSPSYSNVL